MQFTASGANTPPSATITSPVNNASFTAPATINITANASDAAPGSVSTVSFYNGSTLLGSDNTAPYTFSWTNAAAGSYALTVVATDNQGATGASSIINVTVVAGNTAPTTTIMSPANNATFTAPAGITITANAADANGTVSKVEFFNGSTKLGEDATSPYSFSWTNVAVGTYSLTTRATDNAGATGTSSVVNIAVTSGTGCSYPQYLENGGYVAGSLVKNAGSWYECKPHPFTGWCNGAAWAYAPGTGTYWADAWILRGTCSGRINTRQEELALNSDEGVVVFPNPGKVGLESSVTIQFDHEPNGLSIQLRSMNGTELKQLSVHDRRDRTVTVVLPVVPAGVYLLKIAERERHWYKKYIIE